MKYFYSSSMRIFPYYDTPIMNTKIYIILLLMIQVQSIYSQGGFAKTYRIETNDLSGTNYFPNFIQSFIVKDNKVFCFFYATDTTVSRTFNAYGSGFGIFDFEGNFLSYRNIPYEGPNNYLDPNGMVTFDHKTFYTIVNLEKNRAGVLKYNYESGHKAVFGIDNIKCDSPDTCATLYAGLAKDSDGNLIAAFNVSAHESNFPNARKIQVTKMDTMGNIKWNTILGGVNKTYYNNWCKSLFVDSDNNIIIGMKYSNELDFYQTIIYKINKEGSIIAQLNTPPKINSGNVYDIMENSDGTYTLLSEWCKNLGIAWFTDVSPAIINLTRSMTLISSNLAGNLKYYQATQQKIVKANLGRDQLFIWNRSYPYTTEKYDSVKQKIDTVLNFTQRATLVKINEKGDSLWSQHYIVREGTIKKWQDAEESNVFELAALPDKSGYLMGGYSYRDLAYEELNEAYYVPLLIKVDNDGCVIPDCAKLTSIEQNKKAVDVFKTYPNPFHNRLILQQDLNKKLKYMVYNLEGKLIYHFDLFEKGDNIIILTSTWPAGTYIIQSFDQNKLLQEAIIIKK